MVWDLKSNRPLPLSRDAIGKVYDQQGIEAALEGSFTVRLADGKEIEVRPAFDLLQTYILENFDPETVAEITWAPREGIIHCRSRDTSLLNQSTTSIMEIKSYAWASNS